MSENSRSVSSTSRGSKRARENQSDPTVRLQIHDIKGGRKMTYKIRYMAPMKALLEEYCKEVNLDYRTVKFTHNGKQVHRSKSAAQLGLEDQDVIEAFVEVRGG